MPSAAAYRAGVIRVHLLKDGVEFVTRSVEANRLDRHGKFIFGEFAGAWVGTGGVGSQALSTQGRLRSGSGSRTYNK